MALSRASMSSDPSGSEPPLDSPIEAASRKSRPVGKRSGIAILHTYTHVIWEYSPSLAVVQPFQLVGGETIKPDVTPRRVKDKGQVTLPTGDDAVDGMSVGDTVYLVLEKARNRIVIITEKEFKVRFKWP